MKAVQAITTESSFLVEIICDELNIRQKADFNSKVVGTVKRGKSTRSSTKRMDLVNSNQVLVTLA